MNNNRRVVGAIANKHHSTPQASEIPSAANPAYAIGARITYQNQSLASASYPVCFLACLTTVTAYANPTVPNAPRQSPRWERAPHGAHIIAEIGRAAKN